MVDTLSQAVNEFRGRKGISGWPAQRLVDLLQAQGGNAGATLFDERMRFCEENANSFFAENAIAPMQPTPLDNGGESLVFDCNNGYVLKLKTNSPYRYFDSPVVLKQEDMGYSQTLHVGYEISKKIETRHISTLENYKVLVQAAFCGLVIPDSSPVNYGVYENDNHKKKIVVIDSGAVDNLWQLNAVKQFPRSFLIPAYLAMPSIHSYWQLFKDTARKIVGAGKKPTTAEKIPFTAVSKPAL